MGDGADMALENAFEDLEHYERYRYSDPATQYEEGIIDEHGVTIGQPWSAPCAHKSKFVKPHGPGACPECGHSTVKREGPYGEFYGCTKFPKCKGTRNG